MKLRELIYEDEYLFSDADEGLEIDSLAVSARGIDESTLLIIPNSKKPPSLSESERYPRAVIAETDCPVPDGIPTVRVENARLAEALVYSRFYGVDYSKISVIGVTGTNGKTSTASFIKHILTECGRSVGFIGTGRIEYAEELLSSKEYSMTTPDPPLLYPSLAKMIKNGIDTVVMEVSSHALALRKVDAIPFDFAVFTNLSPEHGDFHPSVEEYYLTKKRLFSLAKRGAVALDDPYGRRLASEYPKRVTSVGAVYRADYYASDIERLELEGLSYIFHGKDFIFKTRLSVGGIYSVYNSALAAAVCIEMGCAPCEVKRAISSLKKIDGRFEIIKGSPTVIIDYAHTDAAYRTVLSDVRKNCRGAHITAVFGCGGERDREKRPRMAAAVEKYADKIIVTSDNSRGEPTVDIICDIIKGFKSLSFSVIADRREAILEAIKSAPEDGIVLLLGKGAERYNIDEHGYHEFDERAVVKEALEKRKAEYGENENKARI